MANKYLLNYVCQTNFILSNMKLQKFKDVVLNYKVVFFDAYGVLKKHNGAIEGVKEMLDFLLEENIQFYIITNDASRSPELLAEAYHKEGIDTIKAENIVSSAMMAESFLKENISPGNKVAYLGRKSSEFYIKNAELIPVKIEEDSEYNYAELGAIMLFDDSGYDFKQGINCTLNAIRSTNIPVIVANPDLIYPVNDKDTAIAIGSLANMFEAVSDRKFFKFGKPFESIFQFGFNMVNAKQKIEKRDIVMVGDTLDTDIIGANNFGIDTVLVLSGSTLANQAEKLIKDKNIHPNYICNSVLD